MPWYYANNDQRLGPVNDTEFARLAREKTIREDTLVWQHGMPDWKKYSEIVPTLPPPEIPADGSAAANVREDRGAGALAVPAASVIVGALPVRLQYAGFWVRAGAKLVDWFILYFVSRLLARALGLADLDPFQLLQGSMTALEPYVQRLMLLSLLDGFARLAFYWFFLKRSAATPGKMLFGLKVVSADGSPLSHGQIVGRFFAEVVGKYFTLCIGYLVAAFDDEKRTMQDHLCKTRVVTKRRE
jgi:uncharacterized RDD family membrane protein YckC